MHRDVNTNTTKANLCDTNKLTMVHRDAVTNTKMIHLRDSNMLIAVHRDEFAAHNRKFASQLHVNCGAWKQDCKHCDNKLVKQS